MKKNAYKKMLAIVLALALCLGMASPAFAAAVVESGVCGDHLTWMLDGAGTLTISGTGAMTDYDSFSPWFMNKEIKTVIIQNGVTKIGAQAFYQCANLTSVTIPDSVTEIGGYAFCICEHLTDVIIPDSVTQIGEHAFSGCSDLKSITIPAGVTKIGEGAFRNSGLNSVVIPNGVTEIGADMFNGCTNLTRVTIPDSVTEIGERAFLDCYGLTSVTIPDSVTKIGEIAFAYCRSLTSVAIPASVTEIGKNAFGICIHLTGVNVDPDNPNYTSLNGVLFDKAMTTLLYYPAGKQDSAYTIPDSVTEISEGAFSSCAGLTSVTVPVSVTKIGEGAFYGCTGLTSVTIPASVTQIGKETFYHCTGLSSVTISASVTQIGEKMFYGCIGLNSVTIPDGVTEIGYEAFCGCIYLTDIYYGGSRAGWNAISVGLDNDILSYVAIHTADSAEISPIQFTDVPSSSYCSVPVAWAVDQGVTAGTSSATFSPDQTCSVAEILTFLWRAVGAPAPTGAAALPEADRNQFYTDAVLWAKERGLVDDTFSAGTSCTRAMAVTYLWELTGDVNSDTSSVLFTDVPSDASYAQAVAWAVNRRIAAGTSGTTFSPDATCTRGQIATFLYRCLMSY